MTTLQIPDAINLSLFVPPKYDILVYGQPKTGKTEFAGTWADAGEVLYIDMDKGMTSLLSSSRITPELKQRIYFVPIKDIADDPVIKSPIGWPTVKGIIQTIAKDGAYGDIQPKTIVIDSITTASVYAMSHVLYVNKHIGRQPTLPDWGMQMRELIELITSARGLQNINFICIAHEQYIKDEITGKIWCLPLITGKLAYQLGVYFDEIYHAHVRQEGVMYKYLLDTKSTGLINAGSRFDLPSLIPTTYQSIKGTIEKLKLARGLQKGGGTATSPQP